MHWSVAYLFFQSDFLDEALKAMLGDAYILKNGKIIPKVADGNQEWMSETPGC